MDTSFRLGWRGTHNTIHSREITEMLKATPQCFGPRVITGAAAYKAAELRNPAHRLAQRGWLCGWRRTVMDSTAPAIPRPPTAHYRASRAPPAPAWWHTTSIGEINHFSRAPRASISSHLARVPMGRASQPPPPASAGCSGGRLAGLPPVAQRPTQAASSGPQQRRLVQRAGSSATPLSVCAPNAWHSK